MSDPEQRFLGLSKAEANLAVCLSILCEVAAGAGFYAGLKLTRRAAAARPLPRFVIDGPTWTALSKPLADTLARATIAGVVFAPGFVGFQMARRRASPVCVFAAMTVCGVLHGGTVHWFVVANNWYYLGGATACGWAAAGVVVAGFAVARRRSVRRDSPELPIFR